MEFGLYTLSDLTPDPVTGVRLTPAQRIEETAAAARLADQAGLDVFGIGEHHRLDYAVSAPVPVLAAIAGQTRQIRLTSAVTVLGAADPVRTFEDFATLDTLSGGRAEIMAGRGAFIEPFPLFGVPIENYDALFVEKFELLRKLATEQRVTWRGRYRHPLEDAEISPRPIQPELPIWIAVGGSAESAARAGALGAPMALAALGGPLSSKRSIVRLYRESFKARSARGDAAKVALSCHVHVGQTSQSARDLFYPYYVQYWRHAVPHPPPPMSREQFNQMTGQGEALMVGSASEIVERILHAHEILGVERFLAQIDIGALPFIEVARVIERLGTHVVPKVRAALKLPLEAHAPGRSDTHESCRP